jgi:hypothetical protein
MSDTQPVCQIQSGDISSDSIEKQFSSFWSRPITDIKEVLDWIWRYTRLWMIFGATLVGTELGKLLLSLI